MSQRGRGSGPDDDERDGEEAARDRDGGGFTLPPATSRPIQPYDPYRALSDDASRRATRNVASEPHEAARRGGETPFLPDDDPLSSAAWQDDVEPIDEDLDTSPPDVERAPPPPRRRRQPAATRGTRGGEAETGLRRASRRTGAAAAAREREPRASVSIGVPRVLAGSALVADQTAMILLGIIAIGVVVMVLLLGVRLGGVPSPTVLHIDAAGNPDRWGPPSVLWRLPLMSFFIMAMFTVVAWFLHPIDRFAARFALGAAAVAQLIAWVAVIQHVFLS